jgi:hypothetical protein
MTWRSRCALALAGSVLWVTGSSLANPQGQSPPQKVSAERNDTLVTIPSGSALVTFANGMLTVRAQGARLIDVLRTTCGLVGAQFNAPADDDQLISRILGPAPAAEILTVLLHSTGLNYAMSRSPNDPNLPMSVTIFSSPHEPSALLTAKAPRSPATVAPVQAVTEITAVNTQPAEVNSADPETADPPDQPSKAQLALLEKLRPTAAGEADASTVPLQRDSGVRRGHPRR